MNRENIPEDLWIEAVHFAWQKRQDFMSLHRERFDNYLDDVRLAADQPSAIIRVRAWIAQIEISAKAVFYNAYMASIDHIREEMVNAS